MSSLFVCAFGRKQESLHAQTAEERSRGGRVTTRGRRQRSLGQVRASGRTAIRTSAGGAHHAAVRKEWRHAIGRWDQKKDVILCVRVCVIQSSPVDKQRLQCRLWCLCFGRLQVLVISSRSYRRQTDINACRHCLWLSPRLANYNPTCVVNVTCAVVTNAVKCDQYSTFWMDVWIYTVVWDYVRFYIVRVYGLWCV